MLFSLTRNYSALRASKYCGRATFSNFNKFSLTSFCCSFSTKTVSHFVFVDRPDSPPDAPPSLSSVLPHPTLHSTALIWEMP